MLSPILILIVLSVMALVIVLIFAVKRALTGSSASRNFEDVLSTITGGDLAEFDSTQMKTTKTSSKWNWEKWWLDATLKAGRNVSEDSSPGRFMLGAFTLSALFGVLVYPGGIAGLYLGFIVIGLARMWLAFEANKRRGVIETQMPMLLAGLRNEMSAGRNITKAFPGVARSFPNPLGDELRKVQSDVEVGIALERALDSLAQRVPSSLMQFLVASLNIGISSGSDLIPQLITLEDIVRMRARIDGKIRSAIALVKPTAYVAEAAPILMFVWESLTDPKYLPYFFGPGLLELCIAAVMYGAGIFVIQYLIRNVEKI